MACYNSAYVSGLVHCVYVCVRTDGGVLVACFDGWMGASRPMLAEGWQRDEPAAISHGSEASATTRRPSTCSNVGSLLEYWRKKKKRPPNGRAYRRRGRSKSDVSETPYLTSISFGEGSDSDDLGENRYRMCRWGKTMLHNGSWKMYC